MTMAYLLSLDHGNHSLEKMEFYVAMLEVQEYTSQNYSPTSLDLVVTKVLDRSKETTWNNISRTYKPCIPTSSKHTLEAATCPRLGHFVTSIHPNMRNKFREVDRPASGGVAILDHPYPMANHYRDYIESDEQERQLPTLRKAWDVQSGLVIATGTSWTHHTSRKVWGKCQSYSSSFIRFLSNLPPKNNTYQQFALLLAPPLDVRSDGWSTRLLRAVPQWLSLPTVAMESVDIDIFG